MGRCLLKEQVLYFSNRIRRRKRVVFVWRRAINTNDVHVAGTGEGKRKSSHISRSHCSRKAGAKMTATPPPRLLLRGKDLMEKPESVKSAMICSSPVYVNQVSVRNKDFYLVVHIYFCMIEY